MGFRARRIAALIFVALLGATQLAFSEQVEEAPLDIRADRLDLDASTRTAKLSGGVVLVRGDLTVNCKELELRYDESSQVTWARGVGGVVATLRDIRAEAKEVSFDLGRNRLELEGGVRVTQGRGARLQATRATIDIAASKVSFHEVRGALPIPPRQP